MKHADLVGAFVARRLGIPLVSTLHVIEDSCRPLDRSVRWLAARARTRTAAWTVAVSDAQRCWYLDTFPVDPSRVVTVHNGVLDRPPMNDRRRQELRAALGISPNSLLATMVAIMRPDKGHAELIAAAGRVPPSIDIRFVLAGDGPLRPRFEAAARADRRTDERIVFAGFRPDIPDLLGASDLIVHPSLDDALPTSLIQGLASALPAVASDVGGIPEIVRPECGVLVPPGDVDALADVLTALAEDSETRRRLALGARRRFESEFDARIWAARLRQIYDVASAG
jgi:glycosyltransferase involved in cell wall biosynthesis